MNGAEKLWAKQKQKSGIKTQQQQNKKSRIKNEK